MKRAIGSVAFAFIVLAAAGAELPHFERMMFNNPGLETDLSLGIWPHVAAYDYDGDGSAVRLSRGGGICASGDEGQDAG